MDLVVHCSREVRHLACYHRVRTDGCNILMFALVGSEGCAIQACLAPLEEEPMSSLACVAVAAVVAA